MRRNKSSTVRHNLVGKAMHFHLNAAGISVMPEPTFAPIRPDFMLVDAASKAVLTDHTIRDPLAASGPTRAHRTIAIAEQQKRTKYRPLLATLPGTSFIPLVFCVLGRTSDAVSDLLHLRSIKGEEVKMDSWEGGPRGLINSMITAVSCAIAKGNAHIIVNNASFVRNEAARIRSMPARAAAPAPYVPVDPVALDTSSDDDE